MIRKAILALALLLVVSTASASELGVENVEFESPIYGGETVEKDFKLSWKGETDTVAHINASLEDRSSDTNRLNLSLAENPVIVPAGGETEATLILAADYFVEPENFTVNVEASTNVEKEVEYRGRGSGGGNSIIIDGDSSSEEDSSNETSRLREELNRSESEKERLEDKIEELENNITESSNDSESKEGDDFNDEEEGINIYSLIAMVSGIYLLIAIVSGLVLIIYIVYLYFSRRDDGSKSYEFKVNK